MQALPESATFVLPDSWEELLWSTRLLVQYLENRLISKRPAEHVYVICRDECFHPLLKACWPHAQVLSSLNSESRSTDLLFEFSPEHAYQLTKSVEKHIGEAYGVLLGTVPKVLLPPVAAIPEPEDYGLVLIADRNVNDAPMEDSFWPHKQAFVDICGEHGAPIGFIGPEATFAEMRRDINRASVVIGVRSSATLIAASMQKIVMELSPNTWAHKNWMSKSEARNYRMVYGMLEDCTAEFIWDRTLRFVQEVANREGRRWDHR